MKGQIYKIGTNIYKDVDSFFKYSPAPSFPIGGLYSPRDMEVGIIPATDSNPTLRGKKGIFICNAEQAPAPDSENTAHYSIVIRDYYNPKVTLKTIKTNGYDTSKPTGIALDLENNCFYTASHNYICKIQYDNNDVLGRYDLPGSGFHDIFLDPTGLLYTVNYDDNSGSLFIIDRTPISGNYTATITGITDCVYGISLVADLTIGNEVLFITSWGNSKIHSFIKINGEWKQKETFGWYASSNPTIHRFLPYGMYLMGDTLFIVGHSTEDYVGIVKKFKVKRNGELVTYESLSEVSSGGNNPTGIVLDNTIQDYPRLLIANSDNDTINFVPLDSFPI